MDPLLRRDIVKFLSSLRQTHTADERRAFILLAGLDPEVEIDVKYEGSARQFWALLVSDLEKYGQLANRRDTDALEAVLTAAKEFVGLDGQKKSDDLIRRWRLCRQSGQGTETIGQAVQDESDAFPQPEGQD